VDEWTINKPLLLTKRFQAEKVEKITNNPGMNKPHGGIWTSPFHEFKGSDWIRWCVDEHFNVSSLQGQSASLLYIADSSMIYKINCERNLIDLTRRFPLETVLSLFRGNDVDFEAASRYYDAIYLTEEGQWQTRLPENPLPTFYGWDCESVLIMNPEIINRCVIINILDEWLEKR